MPTTATASEPLTHLRSAALPPRHGFFGRTGGVSTGDYRSLNCGPGSGDDPEAVAENRRRVTDAILPGATLLTLYQCHSARAVVADTLLAGGAREADALVTRTPGLILGILTADCAPVLLADRRAGVIGAAHAGWRGAFSGVLEATLDAMERLGARRADIAAVVGPCIGAPSYEVDAGFFRRFLVDDAQNARFFTPGRAGHHHFALEDYVMARLAAAGAGHVEGLHRDTLAEEALFFSYRRGTLAGTTVYGRQISVIAL